MTAGRNTSNLLRVGAWSLMAACAIVSTGCGSGEQTDDATALAGAPESSSRWTINTPLRKRDLPAVNASQAARQVALMGPVGDPATKAQIDLLARVYQLAIESDGGANDHFVLVAGAGVQLSGHSMDEHEFALRVLARLGTMSAAIAWAPQDVQQRVRMRHDTASRAAANETALFPGTRNAATIVTLTLKRGEDPTIERGSITLESPNGRAARQGVEARRDAAGGWSSIRLTGVRMSW